ncbi:MAG TPA: MFS transporter, partial [Dehalococcoidia bacterium]|nr:MFS transporter [Dehalococcoidia bacterium]
NVALPSLREDFGVSRDEILWISLVPMLVATGISMTVGRIGDLFGSKRPYVFGFVLFTLATGAAAAAGSFEELLAARVAQSIGLAGITASLSAIVTSAFSASQRGRALGFMAASIGLGMAIGPLFAGAVLELLDWRAVFWLRVPLFALASWLVVMRLRDAAPDRRAQGLDVPGAMLLSAFLFVLVLAINRGEAWGWSSVAILGLLASTAVLLPLLIWVERSAASPTLALGLFRSPGFSGGVIASGCQAFGFAAVSVLTPFYLTEARGLSIVETGALMATFPAVVLFVGPFGGRWSDRAGARKPSVAGLLVGALALVLLGWMSVDEPIFGIVLRLLVIGVARGFFDAANQSMIMGSVETDRLATASAALSTSRSIGQSVGIAAAGAIFTAQAAGFASARSAAGLDDPAVLPGALLHGLEWALTVSAAIAVAGAVVAWVAGSRGGAGSADRRRVVAEARARPTPNAKRSSRAGDLDADRPPRSGA